MWDTPGFGEEMTLAKRAAVAFAMWFSLSPGVIAQVGPVSENIAAGGPCMAVNPTNPSAVTPKKVEDTVLLNVRISKSGVVHDMKVFSGPPTLTEAAIKAAKRWKYKPAYFVTGPPSERQTFLSVTLVKGAVPKVEEVALGVPGCISAPSRVRVSQTFMQTLLLSRVEPLYPPEARTEHMEGIVVVRVTVDNGGNVYKVENVSGPPVLVPAAIEAVKQWKYQPYLLNGEAIEVESTVEISFAL
jgi:TonB family protein